MITFIKELLIENVCVNSTTRDVAVEFGIPINIIIPIYRVLKRRTYKGEINFSENVL